MEEELTESFVKLQEVRKYLCRSLHWLYNLTASNSLFSNVPSLPSPFSSSFNQKCTWLFSFVGDLETFISLKKLVFPTKTSNKSE